MKEEDEATHYEDARTDAFRSVPGTLPARNVGKHQDGRPRDDDDDAGECKVPVALKDPKQVSADSLQSPHDPDVTYSGHKGKGYEVWRRPATRRTPPSSSPTWR